MIKKFNRFFESKQDIEEVMDILQLVVDVKPTIVQTIESVLLNNIYLMFSEITTDPSISEIENVKSHLLGIGYTLVCYENHLHNMYFLIIESEYYLNLIKKGIKFFQKGKGFMRLEINKVDISCSEKDFRGLPVNTLDYKV